MKIHRFIIPGCDFHARIFRITEKELVHQIARVLKLREGEQIVVGDGNLNEARIKITAIIKNEVAGDILEIGKNTNELPLRIALYCALLKRENFELVAQKATEVGVAEIIPCSTERMIKLGVNSVRLSKIIKEAAEQSERGIIPELREPISFEAALARKEAGAAILFDRSGESFSKLRMPSSGRTAVFVGPEGGWGSREISLAREQGVRIVSLSPFTLRAETAAIVASYLVAHGSKK